MNSPEEHVCRPRTVRDGHFLEMELHHEPGPSTACRIVLVYLESSEAHVPILTEPYPSRELLIDAFVSDAPVLLARARELCPTIDLREESAVSLVRHLAFEPRDLRCDYCGSRPGEPCDLREHVEGCLRARQSALKHFLVWLAERRQRQTRALAKKHVVDIAEMLGYSTAENLHYRGHEVVVTAWSTGDHWRLYVGGRLDPTKSVWMTRGTDLVNPEKGPLRNEQEIALALRAVGRAE